MKLSISLSDAHVALIDLIKEQGGFESRSAVIQHALSTLDSSRGEAAYAAAWTEWEDDGDEALWASAGADGVPQKRSS